MTQSGLPPEMREALRRALTIPPETLEAMRKMASVRLPPETLEAMRKMASVRLPPETLEAMRKMTSTVSLPPETLEAMRRGVTIPPETFEAMRRALTIAPETAEAFRRLATQIQIPKLDAPAREALMEASRRFRELWKQALPSNWADFDSDDITATIERVRLTGFSLVWIPRAEIVREVLAAAETDTARVLLARRDDVLDDASECLTEVTDPDLALIREAVEQAIRALRDDIPLAAQALASVAFTSEIHQFFEMGTTASRKRMAEKDPEDVPLGQLRLRTIFIAGAKALDEFRPDRALPVRREFNRHNSAHRLTPEQWTEANALSGIMLSTSLLREMHYWYRIDSETT